MIYLDNSATTKIHPEVLQEMHPFLENQYGNPSSTYKLGQQSKFAEDKARRIISQYINTSAQEIIFTSGGTESINLAIKGTAEALALETGTFTPSNVHIITSSIEHSAVLSTIKHMNVLGYQTHIINVDQNGYIKFEELEKVLNEVEGKIIGSFQHANSEIGTIQDIKKITELIKSKKGIVHIDAMQSAKFFSLDVEDLNIDMMTFAPHKFNGPKGVGGLYLKKTTPIVRQMDGGQQEYYLRSGTENVSGIVGFGKAIEILSMNREEYKIKTLELSKYFQTSLISQFSEKISFNSDLDNGLPSIVSVTFKNNASDQVLIQLDMNDICVSAGSACNSGSIQLSPVLKLIGLTDIEAQNTVRFSFGHENTKEEVDKTIDILNNIID